MADRFEWQAVLLIPRAGPSMQRRYLLGVFLHQARVHDIVEEVVLAIPLPRVIERNDEQIASFQDLQHPAAIFSLGDGIAQRTT